MRSVAIIIQLLQMKIKPIPIILNYIMEAFSIVRWMGIQFLTGKM